ncbi:hypothetical protein C3V39_08670 [Prevotella sp. oral taxon 820]|nr:hypothetical protein C3V39_08670 [Prevotella sp. oral taxon 820]
MEEIWQKGYRKSKKLLKIFGGLPKTLYFCIRFRLKGEATKKAFFEDIYIKQISSTRSKYTYL